MSRRRAITRTKGIAQWRRPRASRIQPGACVTSRRPRGAVLGVCTIDAAISEIRSTIFGLKHGRQGATSLCTQVVAAVTRAAESLGFLPRLNFEGPIDAAVPDAVAEHLLAVVRESLTNVARHANASTTEVSVSAGDELVLRVTDDGRGLGRVTRSSGLRNLQQRAESLGGTFVLNGDQGGGTRLEWRIPLHV